MNKIVLYNWMTSLKNTFGKTKPIQVISMTKEEWLDILLKFDVLYIGIIIDCDDHRKSREHYIKNIPKVIDSQKAIFDVTNYPGYVIIHISSNDDLSTLCETYNNIYRIYGKDAQIEIIFSRFHKEKDSDEYVNIARFPFKTFPISLRHFDNIKRIIDYNNKNKRYEKTLFTS